MSRSGQYSESDIKNLIRLALSKCGCKIFNSYTGTSYTKKGLFVKHNQVGCSDLHGHRPEDGRAFYIEVKKPGHRTDKKRLEKQANFINEMKSSGALAGFAQSVDEALEIIEMKPCK